MSKELYRGALESKFGGKEIFRVTYLPEEFEERESLGSYFDKGSAWLCAVLGSNNYNEVLIEKGFVDVDEIVMETEKYCYDEGWDDELAAACVDEVSEWMDWEDQYYDAYIKEAWHHTQNNRKILMMPISGSTHFPEQHSKHLFLITEIMLPHRGGKFEYPWLAALDFSVFSDYQAPAYSSRIRRLYRRERPSQRILCPISRNKAL